MIATRRALHLLAFACVSTCAGAESLRYRINGVEVEVEHARGSAVSSLVARHLASRPRGPDQLPAQWSNQGRWRQLASVEGAISRVLQISGAGAQAEAIRSTVDLRRPIRRPGSPPLWLPPASQVLSDVESLRADPSQQWIARSTWSTDAAQGWLRLAARMQGWAIVDASAQTLQLRRGPQQLRAVVLDAGRSHTAGSIVVLTRWGGM